MQVLLLFSSVNRSTSPGNVFHPSISGGFFNEIEPPAEASRGYIFNSDIRTYTTVIV